MSQPPVRRSRLLVALSVWLVVGAVVLAALVVLLVRDGRLGGASAAATLSPYPVEAYVPPPGADPTRGEGTAHFQKSGSFARDFAAALAAGRSEAAYAAVCVPSRRTFPDAAVLQARFDELVGGRVVRLTVSNVVGDGPLQDDVTLLAELEGGGRAGFAVAVQDDGVGHLAACDLDDGSSVPEY